MSNRIGSFSAAMGVSLFALVAAASASAATIDHEDAGNSFRTFRSVDSAPVGRLTVSSSQTISGFGVDVDLNGNGNLSFLIYDSSTTSILYNSGPEAFTDTGAGYKYSNAFSFTFNPGTVYGLTAASDVGGSYFVDFTPNNVGGYSFLTGNQNISGAGHTLGSSQYCCDVGTSLVASGGVPEPATWTLMIGGFGGLGAMLRRRRGQVAFSA
jgi:hypothetical protein